MCDICRWHITLPMGFDEKKTGGLGGISSDAPSVLSHSNDSCLRRLGVLKDASRWHITLPVRSLTPRDRSSAAASWVVADDWRVVATLAPARAAAAIAATVRAEAGEALSWSCGSLKALPATLGGAHNNPGGRGGAAGWLEDGATSQGMHVDGANASPRVPLLLGEGDGRGSHGVGGSYVP